MSKAELITWLAALPDDSPDLARVNAIRRGVEEDADQGLLILKELAAHREIRLCSTQLWRLGIKSVAESFGGRPRYRLSRALEYLRSPACAAVREELRRKRREKEAARKGGSVKEGASG